MITLFATVFLFTAVKSTSNTDLRVQTEMCGDSVTIKCDQNLFSNRNGLVWYKQSLGKVPELIVRKYLNSKGYIFDTGFENSRFSITIDESNFNLNIKDTTEEDTGTYICGEILGNTIQFGSGTLVHFQAVTNRQSPIITIYNAESDTLQCLVQEITSCADEQKVYWFKHGSRESHTGVIYTHGHSTDQCRRSSEAGFPTKSCSYTFPKSSLGPADAGIYSCAVEACGKILFGNGTKVDVKAKYNSEVNHRNVIVLTTSNIIFGIIIIVLIGVIVKNKKGAVNHTDQAEAEIDLNYAAVSFAKKPSSSRIKSRVKNDQDIYAQVKI